MAQGALIQVVAVGAQDQFLTGSPQITFFENKYEQHTNFSVEGIECIFNGNPNFGNQADVLVTRSGDLITAMYLKVELPALDASVMASGAGAANALVAWVPEVGFSLIEKVEFLIGGTTIDTRYGTWFSVARDLSRDSEQDKGFDRMIGNDSGMTTLARSIPARTLYVPLSFWFSNDYGLALPLIALQYHEVRLRFKFRTATQLVVNNVGANFTVSTTSLSLNSSAKLLCNYVYLDRAERKKTAQSPKQYLITQLQNNNGNVVNSTNPKERIQFNHPTKYLEWHVVFGRYKTNRTFLAYNPNDWDSTLDVATRRFIYQCAEVYATNNAIIVYGATDTRIVGNNSVRQNATLAAVFASLAPQVIGMINGSEAISQATVSGWQFNNAATPDDADYAVDQATFNDITYEAPLSWRYASMPTDTLFSGVTVSSVATAANMGFHVRVNDWNNHGLYLNRTGNPVKDGLLKLNNQDRFSIQNGDYFNSVVPFECFKSTPRDGTNVYSFALHPLITQPSGSLNFSRIDNSELHLHLWNQDTDATPSTFTTDYLQDSTSSSENTIEINGINVNLLRVLTGMGGLAYSS